MLAAQKLGISLARRLGGSVLLSGAAVTVASQPDALAAEDTVKVNSCVV